jgi:hypothetical protein
MSFRITTSLVIFLISFSLRGQNSVYKSDSLTFIKESKTLIIKLIGAYMEDYESYKQATKGELSNDEKEGKRLFRSTFIENIESSPDPNSLFVKVLPFLEVKKNGWSITGSRFFKELVKNQNEELENKNKTFRLESISHNVNIEIKGGQQNDPNKRVAWNKVLSEINKKEPEKKVETAKVTTQKPAELKPNPRTGFRIPDIIWNITSLLIGGIIGYLLSLQNADKQKKNDDRDINRLKKELSESIRRNNTLEKEKHNPQRKPSDFKPNIIDKTKLETETNDIKNPKPDAVLDDHKRSEPNLKLVPEQKTIIKTLFFGPPNTRGGFEVAKGTRNSEGVTYFKIDWEDGSREGKIAFVPVDNLFGRALDSIDQNLKPVCDIDNYEGYTNAKRIELLKTGKVFLTNKEWTIDPRNKIQIRLI